VRHSLLEKRTGNNFIYVGIILKDLCWQGYCHDTNLRLRKFSPQALYGRRLHNCISYAGMSKIEYRLYFLGIKVVSSFTQSDKRAER